MPRTTTLALALLVAAAGTATAEPAKPTKKKPAATQPAAAVKPTPAPTPVPRSAAVGWDGRLLLPPLLPVTPPLAERPIELFPSAVLGDHPLVLGGGVSEKLPGATFGGGWKGEALTAVGMAAGFAALVGLCGGGRCVLPDSLPGGVDSGPGISAPPAQTDQRVRQVR